MAKQGPSGMRNSMKGPDTGPSGKSAKLTKNPSYDGEVADEDKTNVRLADLNKSGKNRVMNSSDDKKRLMEQAKMNTSDDAKASKGTKKLEREGSADYMIQDKDKTQLKGVTKGGDGAADAADSGCKCTIM